MAQRARKASPAVKATAARKAPARKAAARTAAPTDTQRIEALEVEVAAVNVKLENVAKFLAMMVAQQQLATQQAQLGGALQSIMQAQQ